MAILAPSVHEVTTRDDSTSPRPAAVTTGLPGPLGKREELRPPQVSGTKREGREGQREDRKAREEFTKFRRRLRTTMQGLTSSDRYRGCGRRLVAGAAQVTVAHAGRGHASFVGLQTCGSKWVCPECAAKVLPENAAVVEAIVTEHVRRGGASAMMTMTVSHWRNESLECVADLEAKAWKALTSDKAWKGARGIRKRYGVTLAPLWGRELTHGHANGWHPHRHVLLLLDRPLSADELAALQAEVYAVWLRKVTNLGGRAPSPVHGVDIRQAVAGDVEEAKRMADYIVKSNMGALSGLSLEMTGGAAKEGRAGSRTPFQVLADIHAAKEAGEEPNPQDVAIFLEFLSWVDGGNRTMYYVPPRVLKALDIDAEEVMEEAREKALAESGEEPAGPRIGVVTIPREEFREKLADHWERREELLAAVAGARDALEAGLVAINLLTSWGVKAKQVHIPLDVEDLEGDGLPTGTEAWSRDLRRAVLAA